MYKGLKSINRLTCFQHSKDVVKSTATVTSNRVVSCNFISTT
jgi:hypothetical protein